MNQRKAATGYLIRFGLATALYALGVLLAMPWARSMGESPWRFAVACLPLVGAGLGIWAIVRLISDVDEMQSRKIQSALVLSTAGTVLVALACGLMQSVGAPTPNWSWFVAVWGFFFGLGTLISAWRYR